MNSYYLRPFVAQQQKLTSSQNLFVVRRQSTGATFSGSQSSGITTNRCVLERCRNHEGISKNVLLNHLKNLLSKILRP